MIDLKRNTKGELVPATGLNSQSWRIYKPNQEKDFTISRSRFGHIIDGNNAKRKQNCLGKFYKM